MSHTFIREWRQRRRMTLADLGSKLDVTAVTVHRWETGKVSPTLEQIIRVSRMLDCSVIEMLHGLRMVPVVGRAISGGEVLDTNDFPMPESGEFVRCPDRWATESAAAIRVDSDALFPFDCGWTLFYQTGAAGPGHLCDGRLSVAQVASDGRRYVRRIARGSRLGLYTLSQPFWDDVEDVPIDWACPIIAARPSASSASQYSDSRRR